MPRFFAFIGTLIALSALPLRAQEADAIWKSTLSRALDADSARDYSHAETLFLQSLHEAERFGSDDGRVVTTLNSLAQNYRHQKKFIEAESTLRRVLSIVEKSDDESVDFGDANLNLATVLMEEGHQNAAIPVIQKALSIYESAVGGFAQKTAAALCMLGDSYRQLRNFAEAERPLHRCADIRETNGGVANSEFADALHSLALAYVGDGKLALAEPRFTLAEKIREKTLGITSPLLAQTMEDHAALLRQMGRAKEAARLTTMASAIRRNSGR